MIIITHKIRKSKNKQQHRNQREYMYIWETSILTKPRLEERNKLCIMCHSVFTLKLGMVNLLKVDWPIRFCENMIL